jgi:hypothetical protein
MGPAFDLLHQDGVDCVTCHSRSASRISIGSAAIKVAPAHPVRDLALLQRAKKREQLARVLERLRSPQLSPGIARELIKQQATLEREIAELEK